MFEIESGLGLVVYWQKDTDLEPLRLSGRYLIQSILVLISLIMDGNLSSTLLKSDELFGLM